MVGLRLDGDYGYDILGFICSTKFIEAGWEISIFPEADVDALEKISIWLRSLTAP